MSQHRKIDWESVRSGLQLQQETLARSEVLDADRLERVYRDRAAAFAARREGVEEKNDAWPALVFRVGDQRYCCPLSALAEVLPWARCTAVPGANSSLLGVMNVRGEIRSVLDLARLLKINVAGERSRGYVLLARHAGREVGLWVDEIEKIENVSPDTLIAIEGESESSGTWRGRSPAGGGCRGFRSN